MKRISFLILLVLISSLFACGGGGKGTPVPAPGGNNSNDQDAPKFSVPISIEEAAARMPSSGYVPNEVLVKTPLDATELSEVVGKYGYTVDYKNRNYAKVHVPDGDLAAAISKLSREQTIYTVTLNGQFRMKTTGVPLGDLKNRAASYTPMDALFGDTYLEPDWDSDPSDPANDNRWIFGARMFLDMASIPGAWDLSFGNNTTIAMIDGGILAVGDTYADLFVHAELLDNNGGTLELQRLLMTSARVNGDGSFTTIADDADIITNVIDNTIYRTPADYILGLTSSNFDFNINYPIDAPGADGDPVERVFPTSLPGIAPAADYMMVATGTIDTGAADPEWVYTADEIAASINYAVDNGADVIVCGMWAPIGDFQPADVQIMQDAVDYARANDVVVVAPVGSDRTQPSPENPDPPYHDPGDPSGDPPVPPSFIYDDSFTAADFVPAGLTGVVSVGSTGVSTPNFPIENLSGLEPYWESPNSRAGYCAADASIYAPGFGLSTFYLNLNAENSLTWYTILIGPEVSTGYVAGSLLLIYSALRDADPAITDIDTAALTILLHGDPANTNQRLLAAGSVAVAQNGGYDLIYPALDVSFNLPVDPSAVTTNLPFSVDPVIADGQPPYEILIDWGDGTTYPASGEFEPYVDGQIYEKTEGYTQPGVYGVTVFARDSKSNVASAVVAILVSNPLGADPHITATVGSPRLTGNPIQLALGTDYIFHASPFNLLSGSSAAYDWDFGDGSAHGTEENPIHSYSGTGTFTVTLTVDDGIRPVITRSIDVNVN
ncbi:MAG: PKD domain-containing protein [bacterium]|jgi:hypothetical protein